MQYVKPEILLNSNYGLLKTIWYWKRWVFPKITGISNKIAILVNNKGRRNEFQSGGLMELSEVLSPPWLTDKKKLSSRRSRTVKTVKFWPCWQLFNSFCFETISFFLLFPFFPFCYTRKWEHHPSLPARFCRPWNFENVGNVFIKLVF